MGIRFNFTKTFVEKVSLDSIPDYPPQGGRTIVYRKPTPEEAKRTDYFVFDEDSGLALRVGRRGKTYYAIKRKNKRFLKTPLDPQPLDVEEARNRARQMIADWFKGEDPNARVKEARNNYDAAKAATFDAVLKAYKEHVSADTSKRDVEQVRSHLAKWLDLSITEITDQMVIEEYNRLKVHPSQANRFIRNAKAAINNFLRIHRRTNPRWQNYINPFTVLKNKDLAPVQARETMVDRDQMKAWFDACDTMMQEAPEFARLFQILMFMGARRSEIMRAKKVQVDLKNAVFVFGRTKNKKAYRHPIPQYTLNLIKEQIESEPESPFLFPSRTDKDKPMVAPENRVLEHRSLSGVFWNPHDLRRTYATLLYRDVRPPEKDFAYLMKHIKAGDIDSIHYLMEKVEACRQPIQEYETLVLVYAQRDANGKPTKMKATPKTTKNEVTIDAALYEELIALRAANERKTRKTKVS